MLFEPLQLKRILRTFQNFKYFNLPQHQDERNNKLCSLWSRFLVLFSQLIQDKNHQFTVRKVSVDLT